MSFDSNDALFCRSAVISSQSFTLTENNNVDLNKTNNNSNTNKPDDLFFVSSTM